MIRSIALRDLADAVGYRSVLAVPMLRDGNADRCDQCHRR